MKEKILSEIILTDEHVEPKAWLDLLNAISKICLPLAFSSQNFSINWGVNSEFEKI